MKYHQIITRLTKKQECQILDLAIKNSSTFSLVWREDFKFKKSAKRIEKKLKDFLVKTEYTNNWPGTEVIGPPDTKIQFYKVTDKSKRLLKEFGSIFKWVAPNYPEDLAFYNEKQKPFFGSVAHEKLVFIIGKHKLVKEVTETISNIEIKTLN